MSAQTQRQRGQRSAPQRSHPRRRFGAVVLVLVLAPVLVAGCGGGSAKLAGATRTAPIDVHDLSLPDVTQGVNAAAAGSRLAFAARPGHLLIQYFGYTSCPDVCPTTLADLRDAFARLSDDQRADIEVAMATVDPERDTPDVLTGYVGSFFKDVDYRVLRTLDTAELKRVEDRFGASSSVTKAADGNVEVAHSAWTYVVDHQGHVVVEWPFGTTAKDIAGDLKILLKQTK